MTAPRTYESRRADGLTQEEWLAKVNAHNLAIPHLPQDSALDPSGLVPYPCTHGIAAKPKRFPLTARKPWLDKNGDERPPYGGNSWGRSVYLSITAFGGSGGVPFAHMSCIRCRGEEVPADFWMAADGSSLLG